jgi:FKBP-type peptidyl-prolyl cis-trans isomerase 2
MALQKNDFLEIEFTAKLKDSGLPFDSNIPKELNKIHPDHSPEQAKPFIFSLGQDMFLKGVDDFFIGKSIEKFPSEFTLELNPEKAFGKRNPKAVQLMPIKVFKEHNLNPIPGIPFNFDGRIGKVLAVSGGRVIVDFNSPLAGKDVIYDIKILRKLEDQNEKLKSFINFIFKKDFPFEVKDKKLILKINPELRQFAEMFKDKFKEIFDLDLEIREVSEDKKTEEKIN